MNNKLNIKIRELNGIKYKDYFKKILSELGFELINSNFFSLSIGDKILNAKYSNSDFFLIQNKDYFGYQTLLIKNSMLKSAVSYLFCDQFNYVGPYLMPTKTIFDNLYYLLSATNDKTIIVVNKEQSINCLINLLNDDVLDFKLYWNE